MFNQVLFLYIFESCKIHEFHLFLWNQTFARAKTEGTQVSSQHRPILNIHTPIANLPFHR